MRSRSFRAGRATADPATSGRWTWGKRSRLIGALLGVIVLGPLLAFGVGWLLVPAPDARELVTGQVAVIDYRSGERLATIRPEGIQERVKVDLDRIPVPVRNAVLAAEDRTFFANPGFDARAILRAAWSRTTGGGGGGSTITQQYIKNATGRDQDTVARKYREIIGAAKLARERSKPEILSGYLNTVYLGRGSYGIEAAARAYFGIGADRLSMPQGALLAGIIQSPSRNDPARNPDRARARWNYVLDGMLEQGWINPTERASARFPATLPPTGPAGGIPRNHLGHVVTRAQAELADLGFDERRLTTEGLRVTTTIDQRLQARLADGVRATLAGNPPRLRAAAVVEDPATGAVVGYYGGADGVGMDYARALRRPGSTFKPFALAAALGQSPPVGLGSEFDGSSPQRLGGQTVANSAGTDCGRCDLKTAMTRSTNTVFYQLALQVGPAAVAEAAHAAGIPAELLPEPSAGIALGDKEVRPTDLASAYATFAAGGVHRRPHVVQRVTDADGRVLYEAPSAATPGDRRFTDQLARNVTESMLDVAAASGITPAAGGPVAAKTGTAESGAAGQNSDAWTVGYTPALAAAVWVGADDTSPITTASGSPIYGRMLPGSIWRQVMTAGLVGTAHRDFGPLQPLGVPAGGTPARAGDDVAGGDDRDGDSARDGRDGDRTRDDDRSPDRTREDDRGDRGDRRSGGGRPTDEDGDRGSANGDSE